MNNIQNYKELATMLETIDSENNGLTIKAMLYNHLVKDWDINENQKDAIIEKCYQSYINSNNSIFREDIEEEVNFAASTYQNGENPYEENNTDLLNEIKEKFKQWKPLEKYNIDFNKINVKKINNIDYSDYIGYASAIIDAINTQIKENGTNHLGYIDMFDESNGAFIIKGKGLSTNDDEAIMGKIAYANNQQYRNGFVILSNEPKAVSVDREDSEVQDENAIATFGNLINYEKFAKRYEIDESTLYEEAHCLYAQMNEEFLNDTNIWKRVDDFLKEKNLNHKCAIVANGNDVLQFFVVPKIPNDTQWLDDCIIEIPKISKMDENKILNFLDELKNEYKDKMNGRFDNYLNSEYEEKSIELRKRRNQ